MAELKTDLSNLKHHITRLTETLTVMSASHDAKAAQQAMINIIDAHFKPNRDVTLELIDKYHDFYEQFIALKPSPTAINFFAYWENRALLQHFLDNYGTLVVMPDQLVKKARKDYRPDTTFEGIVDDYTEWLNDYENTMPHDDPEANQVLQRAQQLHSAILAVKGMEDILKGFDPHTFKYRGYPSDTKKEKPFTQELYDTYQKLFKEVEKIFGDAPGVTSYRMMGYLLDEAIGKLPPKK